MKKIAGFFKQLFIYILLLLFIMPFLLILLNAFKTTEQFVENPFSIPTGMSFHNFSDAFVKMDFLKGLSNSLIITVLSISLLVVFSSMAAYLFVRVNWRINKFLFMLMITSMIIPFQAIMIPLVSIYGSLHALNNKWILIFMYLGFGEAFAVFTFHGFIKGIPLELEESAVIDGCSRLQTFFLIVFPLLKSVVVTIVILDVLWIWNDYLLPSLILLSPGERTLPLSTYNFFSSYSVDFAPLMAGLILTIIPVLIIYIFAQKQIIKGVMQGALK